MFKRLILDGLVISTYTALLGVIFGIAAFIMMF